jgi:glycogen debranching enzyme
MAGLMSGIATPWAAAGALAVLGELQATEDDPWRDAEPGKFPHELRRGERATFKEIPHSPYFGAHDAPALYCLTLWHAWRWSGSQKLISRHLGAAEAALRWCETLGDRDGDGLLEYGPRSNEGYFNQSWKDAEDGIPSETGDRPVLPLATVELQGYLFAARLAMAEIYESLGRADDARAQRCAAETLRARVEDRFWLPEEHYYALALDGRKDQIRSLSSNPGHLLWCWPALSITGHGRRQALALARVLHRLGASHPLVRTPGL